MNELTNSNAPLTPESPATLKLQLQQLVDGSRRVVMFPKGTPLQKKPKGMQSVETPQGMFIYDPKAIRSREIAAAVDNDSLNEILGATDGGMGPESKQELDSEPVAVVGKDEDGTTAQGTLATEDAVPETVDQVEKVTPPGGKVEVTTPEAVIVDRKAGDMKPPRPGETPNQFKRRYLRGIQELMRTSDPGKQVPVRTNPQGLKVLAAWLAKGMPDDLSIDRTATGPTGPMLLTQAKGKWALVPADSPGQPGLLLTAGQPAGKPTVKQPLTVAPAPSTLDTLTSLAKAGKLQELMQLAQKATASGELTHDQVDAVLDDAGIPGLPEPKPAPTSKNKYQNPPGALTLPPAA